MLDRVLAYGLMAAFKAAILLIMLIYALPYIIDAWHKVEQVTNMLGGV